jgi:hypothetical protein
MNRLILMRPDFANTEYMNVLQQEWQSHDFSTGILQAVAPKTSQTLGEDSQKAPARANCGQVGNAGSVGQVEKDRAVM